jgi:uncharacterized membrane protein
MRSTAAVVLAVVLMSGCVEQSADAPADAAATASPVQPEDATPAEAAPTPATAPDSAVRADVVVSTNEPFWQARAEGRVVTLTGVDAAERRLDIQASGVDAGGRVIRATDAKGEVELRIVDGPCEDSMSGASFPLGGTLAIDGTGPIRGCARPASMPPPRPPEEDDAAVATIPARFLGRWAPDDAACRNPDASIEGLVIAGRELRFHESIAVPAKVGMVDADTLRLTANHEGEGERWTSEQTLQLSGNDTLTITGPGDTRFQRIRCAAR